jgi:hypothetical protein
MATTAKVFDRFQTNLLIPKLSRRFDRERRPSVRRSSAGDFAA